MYPAEAFRETVAKLMVILDRFGVRFHMTGGAATIAYGEPRMTQDIDLVVDPQPLAANIVLFLEAVKATGFLVDEETATKAVAEGGMFQLLDLGQSLKVDRLPRLTPALQGKSTDEAESPTVILEALLQVSCRAVNLKHRRGPS